MNIEAEQRGRAYILRMQGELTAGTDLKSHLLDLMEQEDFFIVLEMSGVSFLNSIGLGELVQLTARANSQGGRLALAGPSPFVLGIFEMTKLDSFFEIHPDLESAVS